MMSRNNVLKWLTLVFICGLFVPFACAKSSEKMEAQNWAADNLESLLTSMMPLRQPTTAGEKFVGWNYVAVITIIPNENKVNEMSCVLIKEALAERNEAYILIPKQTSFRHQLSRMYFNGMREFSGNSKKNVKFDLKHLVGGEMGNLNSLVTELGKLNIPAVPPSHFMCDGTACDVEIYSGNQIYTFHFLLEENATETRKKNSFVNWIFNVVDCVREGKFGK